MGHKFVLLFFLALMTNWINAKSIINFPSSHNTSFTFDILHLNDIHSHFDPINAKNGRCHVMEEDCYGGFPRLYKAIIDHRQKLQNSMLLNAGDYYQGTIWYSEFKYQVVAKFANMLNYTAMSLGNHEFDQGLDGIEPFLEETQFPILACNIKDKSTQQYKFTKSIVDESLGKKVGIIGYVSSSTPTITNATVGQVLEFTDEIECIREEARKLKNQGIDILVALGHSGYEKDKEIAEQVEDIDIVVGGHSHTLLYPKDEKPKLNEWVKGDYPTYVMQPSGRVVPVVQAFCFSKYLGHIQLNFNDDGELLEPVKGAGVTLAQVHLLDGDEELMIKEIMKPYQDQLAGFHEVVGRTNLKLGRSSTRESTMGNLVTDSMVHGVNRSDVSIAFINSGGLRANLYKGSITLEDILSVLPFGNSIDLVRVTGKSMKLILENVASAWQGGEYSTFLQVSRGIKLKFYITETNRGQRLKNAQVQCPSSPGYWCDVEDDEIYNVILPSFLSNGGMEGPNFDNQALFKETNLMIDRDALRLYIEEFSPLNVHKGERIVIDGTTPFVELDMELV